MSLTLDKFTNPYIPRSIVPRLPPLIGRWLGGHKPTPVPDYVLWFDIFVGSFVSILTIEGVFMHSTVFLRHHSPLIIASYGASAVLMFNANGVPLAQPRNVFFGHFLSALIGVCIQKLFGLSQTGRDHYYVGGALSMALSSVVMLLTNTVHPPSGASALIPVVDDEIRAMGWWYIPAHLVSSVLMIAIACITNNVFRKYPTHWWTAYNKPEHAVEDVEKNVPLTTKESKKDEERQTSQETQSTELAHHSIIITSGDIVLPDGMEFNTEELTALEFLRVKLQKHGDP